MNISQIHSVSHYNQNYIWITINENKVYAQISSDEIKNILNYAIIYSPEMHSEIAILVGVYNKIITSLNNKDSVSEVNELANNFTNKRIEIVTKSLIKLLLI